MIEPKLGNNSQLLPKKCVARLFPYFSFFLVGAYPLLDRNDTPACMYILYYLLMYNLKPVITAPVCQRSCSWPSPISAIILQTNIVCGCWVVLVFICHLEIVSHQVCLRFVHLIWSLFVFCLICCTVCGCFEISKHWYSK